MNHTICHARTIPLAGSCAVQFIHGKSAYFDFRSASHLPDELLNRCWLPSILCSIMLLSSHVVVSAEDGEEKKLYYVGFKISRLSPMYKSSVLMYVQPVPLLSFVDMEQT